MTDAVQENRLKRARKDWERAQAAFAAGQQAEGQQWQEQAQKRIEGLDNTYPAVATLAAELAAAMPSLPQTDEDIRCRAVQWFVTAEEHRSSLNLCQAIAAYGEAIKLIEKLDPSVVKNRAALAMPYMNRGNVYRDTNALNEAIADYERAIELREALRSALGEQWPPQFSNDLALAYMNRGNAYDDTNALSEAIADYGRAIELGEALRSVLGEQWPPTFRNDLASAYMNRGNTYRTTNALNEALADHSFAIELREALRIALGEQWPPQFRNDLASAYSNRGNTYSATNALTEAIADYGRAIELGEALRSTLGEQWSPKFRNALATAYTCRGDAYYATNALTEAIADYGRAIKLREALRRALGEQWPAGYRNDLASACAKRGYAYRATHALNKAIADFGRAIELNDPLPAGRRDFDEIALKSRTGAAFCLLESDIEADLERATDLAEEACARAAASEGYASRLWRSEREYAFGLALQGYFATAPRFIPEFVLDHLDPERPGAAVDSRPMLDNARSFLFKLIEHPDSAGHPAWAADAQHVLLKVAQAEALYFSGTLDSAARRAEALLKDDQPDAALAELLDYTARHPDDPDGHATRAAFRQRLGDGAGALDDLVTACAKVIDFSLPLDTAAAREKLERLLKLGVAFHLHAYGLDGAGGRERMLERCDAALAWLLETTQALGAQLGDEEFACFDAARSLVQSERRQWLDASDQAREQELLDQIDQRISSVIDALKEALAVFLPRAWRQVVDALLDSLHAVLQEAAAGASNPEATAPGRETLIRAMAFRLRNALESLAEAELAEARNSLNLDLGPLWDALAETEQSALAVGLRLMAQSGCEAFAALSFAQVVEQELRDRLYLPLRESLVEQGQRVDGAPNSEPDRAVAEFVSGQRSHVTMGPLLVGYFRAVAGGSTPASQWLRQVMAGWPAAHLILSANDDARRHREAELRFLLDRRNACAHANDPITGEQLQRLRHAVVGDAEHGFLRYFIAAHCAAVSQTR